MQSASISVIKPSCIFKGSVDADIGHHIGRELELQRKTLSIGRHRICGVKDSGESSRPRILSEKPCTQIQACGRTFVACWSLMQCCRAQVVAFSRRGKPAPGSKLEGMKGLEWRAGDATKIAEVSPLPFSAASRTHLPCSRQLAQSEIGLCHFMIRMMAELYEQD